MGSINTKKEWQIWRFVVLYKYHNYIRVQFTLKLFVHFSFYNLFISSLTTVYRGQVHSHFVSDCQSTSRRLLLRCERIRHRSGTRMRERLSTALNMITVSLLWLWVGLVVCCLATSFDNRVFFPSDKREGLCELTYLYFSRYFCINSVGDWGIH